MNFSKSHFINELKKAKESQVSESLNESLNEAKKEEWSDIDTLQDFSVLVSKMVKAVLPNLKKLESKKLKGFEKLLRNFQEGLDDLSESVNEFFSIDPDKQAEFIKKAWYDGLHTGRTTTGKYSLRKWEKFAKEHHIKESDATEEESVITEKAKFSRLPKDLNAMWNLKNSVESMVGRHDNGDDYDPKVMRTIEEFIKEIKKAAKSFNSKEEVIGTVYELDSAGHPSRIKLRDPKTARINRINALYDAYTNLAKHMEDSGEPKSKIDELKAKAEDLLSHVKNI